MVTPTVRTGLIGDDFLFKELLTGKAHRLASGSFFGLFTFVNGDPAQIEHLKETGQIPWWAADRAQMSFWRPLSELTHWVDYQIWPTSPTMMHAHSILWYALLIYLLGRLYRTLDTDRLRSGLATLIFAFSALHLMTVIWLAARNQLIAGCFIVTTMQFFHQWRQGSGKRFGLLAWLSMTSGLLSAEAGLAALAYLLAYVVAYEAHKTWRSRAVTLFPFIMLVITWRAVYSYLGHGSAEMGGYIDPLRAPGQFAQALLERLPTLLAAYLYGVTSTTLSTLTDAARPAYAFAAASATIAGFMVSLHFQIWSKPVARFFGLGAVLSLIPVCAAEPNDRLLINAEFGLSAVLAILFAQVAKQRPPGRRPFTKVATSLVAMLAVVHLLIYPLANIGVGALTPALVRSMEQDEPMSLPDFPVGSEAHVILVNPPKALFVGYYPWIRQDQGLQNPDSMQALVSGDQPLSLTVLNDSAMRLTAPLGFGDPVSRDFVKRPFRRGDSLRAGSFLATVREVTPYGKPKVVDFEFDVPLRSSSLHLFRWGQTGYEPLALPEVGQAMTLPAIRSGELAAKRIKAIVKGH